MPMEDVSTDQTMINWLRQAGHAHLLDEQLRNKNPTSSPPLFNPPLGQSSSSPNYPPQTSSFSSPPPLFGGGFGSTDPLVNSGHQSGPYPSTHLGGPLGSPSPPIIAPFNTSSSPLHMTSSPTQLIGSNMNQQQIDMEIEHMKRDPNTRIVNRPPQEDIVYKQRVFVRYLQPPTPPAGGTIIVREKQPPAPHPDPPIVIKRAPPPPPTPPPVIIRERPPPIPPPEGTTVIDKIVPLGPKPPRQVVIEQYPPLPPKPQNVIIERWLPMAPRQRRIVYERLPASLQQPSRPIIVQYGSPHVRVQREVIATPGGPLPFQQMAGQTDLNQLINQLSQNQQTSLPMPLSSLGSYNPHSTLQPSYGAIGQSQPNIVIMQNSQPNALNSSSYGMPLSCVCTPNQSLGLGAYGAGLSTVPTIGQSAGQSTVFNVPDNVPIDNVLRQLGIDPNTLQRSGSAPHSGPASAVSHVWNAASHVNPPHSQNANSAVSHVWNAASHALDHPQHHSAAANVWDRIEHQLHPQQNSAVRSVWDHIPHQGGPPHSNYPPPPPPPNYPPHSPNYPPSSSNYPPPGGPGGASGNVLSRLFGGGGGGGQ